MPSINLAIVVHEIPTYLGAKPVQQWLHPVLPRKATAIKVEGEKLLKVGFIYPIPLIDWVSNIIPVTKKEGFLLNIAISIACVLMTIILLPLLIKSSMNVLGVILFHAWMVFLAVTRLKSHPPISIKRPLSVPGALSLTKIFLFV